MVNSHILSRWEDELSIIDDEEFQLTQNTVTTEKDIAVITDFNMKKDQRRTNKIKELIDIYFWIVFDYKNTTWLYPRVAIMLLNLVSGFIFASILALNIKYVYGQF